MPAVGGGPSPLVASYNEWAGGRLAQTGRYALPRDWQTFLSGSFGPLSPMLPIPIDAPESEGEGPQPRRYTYPVSWNLPHGVPGDEGLKLASFSQLRTIADSYSVARACVQTRIQEIVGLDWEIVPTKDAEKAMQGDKAARRDFDERRVKLQRFFNRPDPGKYHNFGAWLAALLEDILVVDALALYMQPPRVKGKGVLGSNLAALCLVAGDTVRPLLDMQGSIPTPPNPAFQVYNFGVPRVDLMTALSGDDIEDMGDNLVARYRGDQMMYLPYVTRSWTPYGFPPIERALVPILSGIQRQQYQLNYFSEGSVPGIFISAGDPNATPTQLRQLQDALNAMAGDPAWKHKIIVLPKDSRIDPIRPVPLADQLDELLMNQVCMAFDIQPQELGITPRASTSGHSAGAANQMAKQAETINERKALKPLLTWLKSSIFDFVIQEICGQRDARWMWEGLEQDEDERANVDMLVTQVGHGLMSIDEARNARGEQSWGLPITSVPVYFTAGGVVPIGSIDSETGHRPPPPEQPGTPPGTTPSPPPSGEPPQPKPPTPPPPNATSTPAHSGAQTALSASHATRTNSTVQHQTKAVQQPVAIHAALRELDLMRRRIAKGRSIQNWTPEHVPADVFAGLITNPTLVEIDHARAAVKRFDPTQPRDDHGRWTHDPSAIFHRLVRFGGHDITITAHDDESRTLTFPHGRPIRMDRRELEQLRRTSYQADVLPTGESHTVFRSVENRDATGRVVSVARDPLLGIKVIGESSDNSGRTSLSLHQWDDDKHETYEEFIDSAPIATMTAHQLGVLAETAQDLIAERVNVQSGPVDVYRDGRLVVIHPNGSDEWRLSVKDARGLYDAWSDLTEEEGRDLRTSGVVESRTVSTSLGDATVTVVGEDEETTFRVAGKDPIVLGGPNYTQWGPFLSALSSAAGLDKAATTHLTKSDSPAGTQRQRRAKAIAHLEQQVKTELRDLTLRLAAGAVSTADFVDGGVTLMRDAIRDGLAIGVRHALTDGPAKALKAGTSTGPSFVDNLGGRFGLYAGQVSLAYEQGYGLATIGQADNPDSIAIRWNAKPGACELCDQRDGIVFTVGELPGYPGDGGFGEHATICRGGPRCRCTLSYLHVPISTVVVTKPVDPATQAVVAAVQTGSPARIDAALHQLATQKAERQRGYLMGLLQDVLAAITRGAGALRRWLAGGNATATKGASGLDDPSPVDAEHVMAQMRVNYPPKAIEWMRRVHWVGPTAVAQDDINDAAIQSWAATRDKAHVQHFADRIQADDPPNPVVAVQEPGESTVKIIDGHHRTLAYRKLGRPVPAYIGFVDSNGGPWDKTHLFQVHRGSDPANKSAKTAVAAGIAVRAADTGRILMLQRAVDDNDPASGYWEFPGGRLEDDEKPKDAAVREWQEETGIELPAGKYTGKWRSANGKYRGYVYSVPAEDNVDITGERDDVTNPDDPDGDQVESLAWWVPAHLDGNPAVRPELIASLDAMLDAIDTAPGEWHQTSPIEKRAWNPALHPRLPAGDAHGGQFRSIRSAIDRALELAAAGKGTPDPLHGVERRHLLAAARRHNVRVARGTPDKEIARVLVSHASRGGVSPTDDLDRLKDHQLHDLAAEYMISDHRQLSRDALLRRLRARGAAAPASHRPAARKPSASLRISMLLNDWANGTEEDDPLASFSRRQLQDAIRARPGVTVRRGATEQEMRKALYDSVGAIARERRSKNDTLPPVGELFKAKTDSDLRRLARPIFEGEFGGLTTTITEVARGDGIRTDMAVEGTIHTADGAAVGAFARYYRNVDGKLTAFHSYLALHPQVQGSGFSNNFNSHLISWYRQSGVYAITLQADIDVGGYAWASAGYDFATKAEAERMISKFRGSLNLLEEGYSGGPLNAPGVDRKQQTAALQELLQRADTFEYGQPGYPTAYEFSQAGRWDGAGKEDTWIGKMLMMRSNWKGVYRL